MIDIWDTPIMAEVEDIIELLVIHLRSRDIDLMQITRNVDNNIMTNCISHGFGQERKPSLGISKSDVYRGGRLHKAGSCNCFTCGYRADLPTFVSNCFGYNDAGIYGFRWIVQNFLTLAVEERKDLKLNLDRNQKTETNEKVIISDVELAQYRFTHDYMYERKLTDKVISYFDVGFDIDTNSLTFPVHDLNGDVRLIQRRSVGEKVFHNDAGGNKGDYLYGMYQVMKNLHLANELYIVESPIDALTLWVHRKLAVAIMGSKITPTQLKLLRLCPIRKFTLALDNDEAGEKGKVQIKKELKSKLLYELIFPSDKNDINNLSDYEISNLVERLY